MGPAVPQITILGSLNIDLVAYVPHHPAPGETLTASSFAVSPGGKGANQAVACAKLSRSRPRASGHDDNAGGSSSAPPPPRAAVRMVGTVGGDSYGTLLTDNLRRHGVDVAGVAVRDELKTGVALIVVDEPTGQNRIVLSPEANYYLPSGGAAALTMEALGLQPTPALLIMQLEIPLEAVLAALRAAKQAGAAVLLNPAPARALPDEAFAGLDHLVLNETEAAMLSGLELGSLDDSTGLERAAALFVAKGVRNVIITLGERGVFYTTAAGKIGLVPAEKATVVDSTAAGDTFVGQYALDVVAGGAFAVEQAVRRANRAAAKTVERMGAQDSIPWSDELDEHYS